MKKVTLSVEKRKILGKKVKKLRKEGLLPANVYGKDVKSEAVQLPEKEFINTFKEVGETGLVELQVDGQVRPVLIHNVQYDSVTNAPIHADFYQVNLKEKVKTMVPLVFVGDPAAVINKVGILLEQLSELEVEALPTDLPENIEVNVEKLANVDEQITVADIKAPEGVTVLSDPGQVVAKIGELITKEAAAEAAAAAAAAEAAKAETTTAEGAAPVEGEAPVEGQTAEPAAAEKPAEEKA
ncbi:MAG TPA: 50S ribosomal protein L25 [Patescibacteria group bacterium]|nr:50S ribosomal protein L25 [Patescibacteria group bacterium]